MGSLLLVRHGQASFGAANYDQLSALGQRQCLRLGEYLGERSLGFEAVFSGTLARQRQSLDCIAQGLGQVAGASALPLAEQLPALDEYDSAAVIAAVHPQALPRSTQADAYRQHMRVLRLGLTAWMEDHTAPAGMPSHAAFSAAIAGLLDRIRQTYSGNVLLVSSGGPIANAIAQVLGAPKVAAIDLNLRMLNSAVSEFAYTPKRHILQSFNTLPHLPQPAWSEAISFM